MKTIYLLGFILICVSSSLAKDLIVGTSYNGRLVWQQKADYVGIPFKKRVKELFYSDPGQQIIKGVIVRETDPTEGNVIITAGGVGFTYVNLRFKSERGSGIYYSVEIYV